jgi:hypothetical protein
MRFFDLVNMPDARVEPLGKRLGYEKMFQVGKDVDILDDSARARNKSIIRSDDLEVIFRGLRQAPVVGLLPKNLYASKKALDSARENEKLVFIPLSDVTCSDSASLAGNLAKTRKLVRSVLMARVPFALVSMAGSSECLMSSLQMIEVAAFLGIEPARAKESMGKLGEAL